MKFVALGDTHLGLLLGRSAKARKKMALYAFNQFKYCIDQAINLNVDCVFHTGDIFDRSNPPDWIIQHYYQVIEYLLDENIALHIIPGNHDKAKLQPSLIDHIYSKYHIYNRLSYNDLDDIRIIGLPYSYNNHQRKLDKIYDWVKESETPSILLTHQLFDNAWFGPQQYVFRNRTDCFDITRFPSRLQVISGHIHRAQTVQNDKVIYTGSTVRTGFAEAIEPKGFLIGDVDKTSISIQFQDIPTLPMRVVEVDFREADIQQLEELLQSFEKPTRIQIRILNQIIDYSLLNRLQNQFPKDDYPYLTISPKTPKTQLKPLYSVFSNEFIAPSIERFW